METRCYVNGPVIGSARLSVTRARFGVPSLVAILRALCPAVLTLRRTSLLFSPLQLLDVCGGTDLRSLIPPSKIWDTYSGNPLHSFPHNHIVRSVAISPTTSHLLSGGQEKKVRIFDLGRPDAEPDILSEGGGLSHDGTIKSVVWSGDNTGVSAGEDGLIK
jgi:WD40 repeat protein